MKIRLENYFNLNVAFVKGNVLQEKLVLETLNYNKEQYIAHLSKFAELAHSALDLNRTKYPDKVALTFPKWPDETIEHVLISGESENAGTWFLGAYYTWARIFNEYNELLMQEEVDI